MNKGDILIHIIQILILIIFMCSIVDKEFQNDTFFTIAIGEEVLENGIDSKEKMVWHEGLEYTNSRWLFDSFIALINMKFGYAGIYSVVMLITSIIGVIWYAIANKITNKKFFSFISTVFIMYASSNAFAARAQIISFFLFIIEFYCIEKLLETNKNRYATILILVAIFLMNIHASVFPMYFVLYLPYIGEYILSLLKLNESDKLIINRKKIKKAFIVIAIVILLSLFMPKGISPYTDMFKAMEGISKEHITELQSIDINTQLEFWILLLLSIAIIIFTKIKIRVSDALFILGFALMSLSTARCVYFYYLISGICVVRLINDLFEIYEFSFDFINKKIVTIVIIMFYINIVFMSIIYLLDNLKKDYVDTMQYPVNATEFIINNIDVSNMKIFNHFNFGSYLELKGIKVFIDSRSGVFTEEFNPGTTIFSDWIKVTDGEKHYNKIFEKYGITHALLYKDEIISIYIKDDSNWKNIYEDDIFVIYEKVEK